MRLREYFEIKDGLKSKLREAAGETKEFDPEEWLEENGVALFKKTAPEEIRYWFTSETGPVVKVNGEEYECPIDSWITPEQGKLVADKYTKVKLVDILKKSLSKEELEEELDSEELIEIIMNALEEYLEQNNKKGIYLKDKIGDGDFFIAYFKEFEDAEEGLDVISILYADDTTYFDSRDYFEGGLEWNIEENDVHTINELLKVLADTYDGVF